MTENKMAGDYMVRATAAEGMIRAFACTSRNLAEEGRRVHDTSPVVTAALGRLMTAGVMMGTMMKGDEDELTLRIESEGPVKSLIVTADSKGRVRGYVANPHVELPLKSNGHLDVGAAVAPGVLSVIRDIGLRDPYVGQINLVSGEIAEDITMYFAASEQVPSSVALGVLVDRDLTVRQAGGMIIQLMPFCPDEVISALEKKLAEMPTMTEMLEKGMTPENVLELVLGEEKLQIMEKIPLAYHCNCSKERVEKAIRSISLQDLKDMARDKKPVEVNCQFCDRKYTFTPEELSRMVLEETASRAHDDH